MNIKLQGIDLLGNLGLKSTQDRLNRQAERDNKIAFFEQQKENLKNTISVNKKRDLKSLFINRTNQTHY